MSIEISRHLGGGKGKANIGIATSDQISGSPWQAQARLLVAINNIMSEENEALFRFSNLPVSLLPSMTSPTWLIANHS